MGLNIKNREARLLAEELSKLTGESITTAVTIALRERLDRVRQQQSLGLADRLLAIGKDCAARLKEPFCFADHGDAFMTNADYKRYPARRALDGGLRMRSITEPSGPTLHSNYSR